MKNDTHDQVLAEIINGIGYITLNRPAALNTINLPMVKTIHQALLKWANNPIVKAIVIKGNGEKAFCAGGDVRRVYECIKQDSEEYEDFFKEEFELDEYIYSYPKPCVALMHGIVMGGGMGLTQGANFRIVCENTKIAMPETAIGYFPDVGASYFLTRRSLPLAAYLGVTGKLLSPQDTIYCGLADWSLSQTQWDVFTDQLESIEVTSSNEDISNQILQILKSLGASNGSADSHIGQHINSITEAFSHNTLEEIYKFLNDKATVFDTWAIETLENMKKNSPLAMAATLQLLIQGKKLSLSEAFKVELDLNYLWKTRGEFVEGVRAALVDKDKKPLWKYSLDKVKTELLKATFEPLFRY